MKMNELIEGLQILAKYEEKGLDTFIGGCEHDVLYGAGAEIDEEAEAIEDEFGDPVLVDKHISTEDQERLRELGWFIDPSSEHWASFA